MGIKADKTFEEIVERIVALFNPQQQPVGSSIDSHTGDSTNPASDTTQDTSGSSTSLIPGDSQDDPGPS